MAETPATTEYPDDASLPDGIRTVQTFRGHEGETSAVAWSPDGARIVTGGTDETVRVWDAETGRELLVLRGGGGSVRSVSWSPGGGLLASGDRDGVVRVWDAETGAVFQQLEGHTGRLRSVSWSPSGGLIASADQDGGVRVWDAETGASHRRPAARAGYVSCVSWSPSGGLYASAGRDGAVVVWDAETGKARRQLARRGKTVYSVSWAPSGGLLAAGGVGSVVRVWDTDTGTERRQLEGHTEIVQSVSWSSDGRALAAEAYDGVVVVWRTDTWDAVAQFEGPAVNAENVTTFHPTAPLLVTHGAKDDGGLRILELEMDILLGEGAAPIERSEHYVNAKVVLLGDSGVGKTALGRALMGEEFEATESTHGRHVWTLNQERVPMEPHGEETRETLLWDLAGQPAYRIIHQLSLEEVAVALVVTDARSETTPLAGVRHWARALRQARVAQGDSAPPITQTLVVARTDRGGLSVSTQRLAAVMEELSFAGSIETSAKTNIGIEELGDAIRDAIQ